LKRNLPDTHVSLVVKPSVRDLVEHCPHVDEILTFDLKSSTLWPAFRNYARASDFAKRELRSRHFDLAIVPRWDVDRYYSSFIAYFSGARYRLGYSEAVTAEKRKHNRGYNGLFTHTVYDDLPKHEVERSLDLLGYLGFSILFDALDLWTTPEDEAYASQVLEAHSVKPGEALIAFGAGARHPYKMWPLENFAELAASICKEYPCRILAAVDPSEVELGMKLQKRVGSSLIDVTGRTTLRQLAALLKRCRLYVGNDSEPKQLAAAAGVPIVELSWSERSAIFVPSSIVNRFKPWKAPHRILTAEHAIPPCSGACTARASHCIRGITVDMATEAVLEQLRKGAYASSDR
jgi:heptosyltransferase-2